MSAGPARARLEPARNDFAEQPAQSRSRGRCPRHNSCRRCLADGRGHDRAVPVIDAALSGRSGRGWRVGAMRAAGTLPAKAEHSPRSPGASPRTTLSRTGTQVAADPTAARRIVVGGAATDPPRAGVATRRMRDDRRRARPGPGWTAMEPAACGWLRQTCPRVAAAAGSRTLAHGRQCMDSGGRRGHRRAGTRSPDRRSRVPCPGWCAASIDMAAPGRS